MIRTFLRTFLPKSRAARGVMVAASLLLLVEPGHGEPVELVPQRGLYSEAASLSFSPHGTLLVAAGRDDNAVVVYDSRSGEELRRFAVQPTAATAISEDDRFLFTAEGGNFDRFSHNTDPTRIGRIDQWDLRTGSLVGTYSGGQRTVKALCLSPDGARIAAFDVTGRVSVWRLGAALPELTWRALLAGGAPDKAQFLSDGNTLLTLYGVPAAGAGFNGGRRTNVVAFWNVWTGRMARKVGAGSHWLKAVCCSDDGNLLACAVGFREDTEVRDTGTGRVLRTVRGQQPFAFRPGTHTLAAARNEADNRLFVYDLSAGDGAAPRVLRLKAEGLSAVAFSPDARTLVASDSSEEIAWWDGVASRRARSTPSRMVSVLDLRLGTKAGSLCIATSSPASTLFGGATIQQVAWDVRTTRTVPVAPAAQEAGGFPAAGRNGEMTSVGAAGTGRVTMVDGKPLKVESKDGSQFVLPQTDRTYFGANFSSDSHLLFVSSGDGNGKNSCAMWDVSNRRRLWRHDGASLDQFGAFSPDGRLLALDSTGGGSLFQSHTEGRFEILVGRALRQSDQDPVFRDHPWIFHTDGRIAILDTLTGTTRHVLSGHPPATTACAFSPDGSRLATGGLTGGVTVWDVTTGAALYTLPGHAQEVTAALFVDDDLLATGGDDGTVKLWNLENHTLQATLTILTGNNTIITTADGYYTASKNVLTDVAFRQGLHAYPFEQFDLRLNRPDKVLGALGNLDHTLIDSYHAAYEKRLEKAGFTENMLGDGFHVPECALGAGLPISTAERAFTFAVKADDDTYPLDRLQVFVNDVPVNFACGARQAVGSAGLSLRGKSDKVFAGEVTLTLSTGGNKVQVSVLNSQGVESLRQTFNVACTAPVFKPDLYVLAVGVSIYKDGHPLASADKDAEAVARFFTGQASHYGHLHILPLINDQVVKENILKARGFLMPSGVNDEVVVFFAGHGLLDENMNYYYATQDIDFTRPQVRGLTYDQIEGLLDGIPARHKLLLMDTCHAGEVDKPTTLLIGTGPADPTKRGAKLGATSEGLSNAFELQGQLFADLRRGSGATVIAAARGVETAGETTAHGYFTQSVLDALQANPQIKVSELRDAVAVRIDKKTGGRQRPVARRENLEDDFPLVPMP